MPTCGLPNVPNAVLWRSQKGKPPYRFNERVMLRCEPGYFARGLGLILTCGSEGWSKPSTQPACSRKCPVPLIVHLHPSMSLQISHVREKVLINRIHKVSLHALVTSKTDYCSSLLHCVTQTQLSKLQRVQNSASVMFRALTIFLQFF